MLIATFQLEHETVALKRTYEQIPQLQIEAERIAAHSTEWTMPCLWTSGADSTSIQQALKGDPSVETVVEETEFGDEIYYQIEWSGDVQRRINSYIDKQGAILRASVTRDGWKVRIRFANRDQFDIFRNTLTEQGFSYSLLELIEPNEPRVGVTNLTPRQREVLLAAWEQGYYEIPRDISSDELAEELGITHQTLSELLRRGTNALIKSQLATPAQQPKYDS
jgi:predicted DNA binding protein